jgi:hypothetical protein
MIFSETWHLVLAGRKRATSRKVHPGDYACLDPLSTADRIVTVREYSERPRWTVGHTYAVQPERCAFAMAHWELEKIERVEHPTEITDEQAKLEGFSSASAFLVTWRKLHQSHADEPVWRPTFGPPQLTARGKALLYKAIELCGGAAA